MASYKKKSSGKWSVRFRVVEDGRLVNKRISGFERKKDAELAYTDFMASYHPSELETEHLTFDILYRAYKQDMLYRLKESSMLSRFTAAERHILPFFKGKKEVTRADVLTWQAQLNAQGYAYNYKAKLRGILFGIFKHGVLYHGLAENPVSMVAPFKNVGGRRKMTFWTEDEFKQFIAVVDEPLRTFFSFLYLTGARRGEALALEWADIDFGKKVAHITKQCDFHTPNTPFVIYNTPKNESSIRDILLPDSLLAMLTNLKSCTSGPFVFNGDRPFAVSTLARKLTKLCDLANVKRIRIHDFRHSHASLLINKGQNILIVAQRLGHKNIEQTLNTYAHLFPSAQEALMQSLNLE